MVFLQQISNLQTKKFDQQMRYHTLSQPHPAPRFLESPSEAINLHSESLAF